MTGNVFTNRLPFIISILVFLFYLAYRVALIFYPIQDAGGVEGNVLYFIQRLLDGRSFYTDPEQTPYAIAQYSPGYYYIVTGIARITGTGADDLMQLFAVNRSVSLVFNLAFIAVVYRMARSIFSLSAALSCLAATIAFIFLEISSYARPDSLYHFLCMLSLYLFMRFVKSGDENKHHRQLLIGSAIVAGAAIFTKQTAFVLPVVAGCWLLFQKKFRGLLIYSASYLAMLLLFFAVIYFFLDAGLFYKNAIRGVDNGISAGWFRHAILHPFYFRYGGLFVLLFVFVLLRLSREKEPLHRFVTMAMLLLFVLLNGVVLKNGSNPGYLTEWWTLVILLTIYYAAAPGTRRLPAVWLSLLCCAVILSKPLSEYRRLLNPLTPAVCRAAGSHYQAQRAFASQIISRLQKDDGYVVFLNLYTPDNYLANLLFRHTVSPQMDIVILASYPRRKYDYSDFEQSLQDGRVKWMVTNATGPQKQFFNLQLNKFEPELSGAGFNLYRFQP